MLNLMSERSESKLSGDIKPKTSDTKRRVKKLKMNEVKKHTVRLHGKEKLITD